MDPNVITQFGLPVGYTVVLTSVVGYLYRRAAEAHAAELKREQDRADRLEGELRELNMTVRDRVVPALIESSRVNAEASKAMGEVAAVAALVRRSP